MFALRPLPPYAESTTPLETIPLPDGLPSPVARFFNVIMGKEVPIIHSAVISGRGKLRIKGVTFPSRWRFTYLAGVGYRHYIEVTVLGWPLMKVNEHYLDGHARLELPFGVVENQPKVDLAANLGLWAEAVWLPSIYITDPRVCWEAVDDVTARLIVPFGDKEDVLMASFDPETGLLKAFETLRYKEASDQNKTGWRNEVLSWQRFHRIAIPSRAAVIWLDEADAWFVPTIDEVVYNVDVSAYIRANGL